MIETYLYTEKMYANHRSKPLDFCNKRYVMDPVNIESVNDIYKLSLQELMDAMDTLVKNDSYAEGYVIRIHNGIFYTANITVAKGTMDKLKMESEEAAKREIAYKTAFKAYKQKITPLGYNNAVVFAIITGLLITTAINYIF